MLHLFKIILYYKIIAIVFMECEQDLSKREVDKEDILKTKCRPVKILLEQKSRLEKAGNLEKRKFFKLEAYRAESRRHLAYSSGSESVIDCGEKPIIRKHKKPRPSSYPIYLRPGLPECEPRRRFRITKKQWILAALVFLLFICALYYAGVFFGSNYCITCKRRVIYN